GHVRTAAQFETTWKELRSALDEAGDAGLLLGASGAQILLDGVPLGAAAAERSFAQLLSTSGIASIHFAAHLSQAQFARFVRAFPSGNAKPQSLAEQLKQALAGETTIKVNEIRYVAEDSSIAGAKIAANLTAKVLGAQGDKFKDFLEDPNRLLQMILAAEGSRGGSGGGPGGGGPGFGGGGGVPGGSGGSGGGSGAGAGTAGLPGGNLWESGTGGGSGGSGSAGGGGAANGFVPSGTAGKGGNSFPALSTAAAALGAAAPANPSKWLTASALLHSGSAGGAAEFTVQEEEIRSMLSLFAQLGRARKDAGSGGMDATTFQSRLSAMPVRNQVTLQQALAGLAAQAPTEKPDQPMLLKLAEHVAIRFALDSYEKGELRVNAVKQLLDRMNTEIEALRKILTSQEEQMASAGLNVQSYTELLDQEFWEQVPDENKKEVLASDEAWCVPPRNVRGFLEEMLRRGELKTVNEILMKYAACIGLEPEEARRTTAIGLGELAELYGSGDGSALIESIRRVGNQLAAERDPELQTLISAAFVRLSQEAGSKRCYPAMQQALASLDSVEAQRPGASQNLRPRIGAEERIPEFVEETLRTGEIADGLLDILLLMPKATINYITNRFGHSGFRDDCELLADLVKGLGEDAVHRLAETLQTASANEAAEVVGLLGQLDPDSVARVLPVRLSQWPRSVHDRVIRQLCTVPQESRGILLLSIFDALDSLIKPLALDEIGMTGLPDAIHALLDLASSDGIGGYIRLKAIEALGRLRATAAAPSLQTILEARQVWRWQYPAELRVAAAQALQRIDPVTTMQRLEAWGFEKKDLALEPTDPEANSAVIRQRRYARLKLNRNLAFITTNLRENFRLNVVELNLGGGIGSGERHLAPGTLVHFKLSQGVRTIKAQALVRGARPQAMAFEFVDMDLEDRARLRKILLELGGLPQAAHVASRARRRGRMAVLK
ncbi:MAG TPA: HEAT repeat domain-containing protein, partial [Candidatus Acidoferrum sp.]|nr:HEAT repeat domain-containing protein [Candidatus Acidoferrum sp.]